MSQRIEGIDGRVSLQLLHLPLHFFASSKSLQGILLVAYTSRSPCISSLCFCFYLCGKLQLKLSHALQSVSRLLIATTTILLLMMIIIISSSANRDRGREILSAVLARTRDW